jgi:hypothetical protein
VQALCLTVLVLIGCASLRNLGTSTPPPSICSQRNVWAYRVDVYLEDDAGHSEWVGWAAPGGHVCAEWTLPGSRGRWAIVTLNAKGEPTDVHRTPWFQSWALVGDAY